MAGKSSILSAAVAAALLLAMAVAAERRQVPGFFIFGDSLSDNGNNNGIQSLAKANYLPYGIDFPEGPTGRFTNGRTAVDVLVELLGFEDFISPYSIIDGEGILRGVNFASAAAGILPETGRQLGERVDFTGQVNNYKNAAAQIGNLLGGNNNSTAGKYLGKCIFFIAIGSNDYINNYFQPLFYTTGSKYSPESYAGLLIQKFADQLMTLHKYGARKFAMVGVGPIGCSPNMLAQYSADGATCVQKVDSTIEIFNGKLIELIDRLNSNLSDSKFTYINVGGIFQEILDNPIGFGFKVANAGCCGLGRNRGLVTCLPHQPPCRNRDEYLFWDAFHPTEAVNTIIARRTYAAEKETDAYPVDVRRLALL